MREKFKFIRLIQGQSAVVELCWDTLLCELLLFIIDVRLQNSLLLLGYTHFYSRQHKLPWLWPAMDKNAKTFRRNVSHCKADIISVVRRRSDTLYSVWCTKTNLLRVIIIHVTREVDAEQIQLLRSSTRECHIQYSFFLSFFFFLTAPRTTQRRISSAYTPVLQTWDCELILINFNI